MESYSQTQWPVWAYPGTGDSLSGYSQLPNYPTYLADSMDAAYQSHQQHLVHHHQMSRTTESKPRLSKEEVEVLEAEFQKNHKPNSNTKKALAESMRVENARINNWFQNRRAREKKENNIRKYEAKQKLEREKAGSDAGPYDDDDSDDSRDLVASSAPFPDPRKLSRSQTQASDTSSEVPTADDSESASQYDGSHGQASPPSHVKHEPLDFEDAECDTYEVDAEQMGDYLAMSDANSDSHVPNASIQSPDEYLSVDGKDSDYFYSQQYQNYLRQNEVNGSHGYLNNQMQHVSYQDQQVAMADDDDAHLKSAPVIDIASRRNRRPPPLAINGSRSYSSAIPKTAADLARRDFGGSMRRVSSATGAGRISKPLTTPRSPFYEQKGDTLYHLNRSPNMAARRGTNAPPTPNTPLVLNAQQSASDLAVHDPTLRTPPTTPGLMDNLFSLNIAHNMSVSDDDGLATPSLGGFSSDFDMPSLPTAVPSYVANMNDTSSQPETPLYAGHMGPAYFGYAGGNPEYNFSDASASAKSSPGDMQHSVHFMNITSKNFNGEM